MGRSAYRERKPFLMPSDSTCLCRQTTSNKTNRTNKSLLRCQTRQLVQEGFDIVGAMAIMLSFTLKSLVGLVTSYFANITVLCMLPKTKEV